MEVIWSNKKYQSEFTKYMIAITRNRKKWLLENKHLIKQRDKNYAELLSIRLLHDNTFQEVKVKSMYTLGSERGDMSKFIKDNDEGLLLRIKNKKRTTIINLTHASPYVMLLFDENLEFNGASHSLTSDAGSYYLQTKYKTILFIKHSIYLKLKNITHLSFIENS